MSDVQTAWDLALIKMPTVATALSRIAAAGGRPYVVGGWVRDALLGNAPKDVDIEVHDIPVDDLVIILSRLGKVDEVGQSFGVVKFSADHRELDFSLPRKERMVSSGHRGVDVSIDPSMGVEAAAARRDFTINAIMFDILDRKIVDPFGGQHDILLGTLQHTSDAFSEDPLRVLRGAQFAARFDMTMSPETVKLCASIKDRFSELAVERVWMEFRKIFLSQFPSRALEVLIDTEWIDHFPELKACVGVPQDAKWHPEGDVEVHMGMSADAAARFARRDQLDDDQTITAVAGALLHDLGKATHTTIASDGSISSKGHAAAGVEPVRSFLEKIDTPLSFRKVLERTTAEHMCCCGGAKPTATNVRRLARRLVPASIEEWARVVEADQQGRGAGNKPSCATDWLKKAKTLSVEKEPVRGIVTGDHLIDFGMKPGPEFRTVLATALAAQEDGVFDDVTTGLAWLDTYLDGPDE